MAYGHIRIDYDCLPGFLFKFAMIVKTDLKSVDEYIASQPEPVREILERVRSAIRKGVPGAEEVISYKMPTYKLHGWPVLYFAGWKRHYSLYPATGHLVRAFKDVLAAYEVNKGTIRFPLSEPVPEKLVERLARYRAKEVVERRRLVLRLRQPRSGDEPRR
jgi:uncharacterized protein YdhG (YjbR/CyaY superfamily)